MYKIFGYLTVFRLEELGHTNLKCVLAFCSGEPPFNVTARREGMALAGDRIMHTTNVDPDTFPCCGRHIPTYVRKGACRRLVDAKEPQKMVVFFRYLLNPAYLHNALRDDWLKLYDKQVDDNMLFQSTCIYSNLGVMLTLPVTHGLPLARC
jgi:hypothetical protein